MILLPTEVTKGGHQVIDSGASRSIIQDPLDLIGPVTWMDARQLQVTKASLKVDGI